MKTIQNDDLRTRHLAAYAADGHGDVKVRECPVCGYLEWASSSRSDTVTVSVIGEIGDQDDWISRGSAARCPKCEEVLRRNPELAAWVVGVVRHYCARVRDA